MFVTNVKRSKMFRDKFGRVKKKSERSTRDISSYLINFTFVENEDLFSASSQAKTKLDYVEVNGKTYPRYTNEFWTAKQRQGNSIHEISYRACFKPQLPNFFINFFTNKGDVVYDPFNGRGTTVIEAALLGRNVVANDINPLSILITKPRLFIPSLTEIRDRLEKIKVDHRLKSEIDLSMFYHKETEEEIVSLKKYLRERKNSGSEDEIDDWIRMVATNRLSGHSKNFFSVYTLPPNQAIHPEKQKKINELRKQIPTYKNVKEIILIKSRDLMNEISDEMKINIRGIGVKAQFFNEDSRYTYQIADKSVQLTVTSPPFLDVVQYADDNWLRCWFNEIDAEAISKKITMLKKIEDWSSVMLEVFRQLYRITKRCGWVAFEVGEVRNGKIKLDEYVIPLGVKAGFNCVGIVINQQEFTKTANIWGIKNNSKGTNTNRIVLFQKD